MDMPNTDQAKAFCQYWLEGNSAAEAARLAGYTGTKVVTAVTGAKLKKKYEMYLYTELANHLKGGGARAYKILCDLMESSVSEQVKLKAAVSVLQFGGYEPASQKNVTITHRTEDEIDAQLNALLGASNVIKKAKAQGITLND